MITHNYYGGAIGNIAYNPLYSLSSLIELHAFVKGYDLVNPLPANLKLYNFPSRFDQHVGYIREANKVLKHNNISVIIQMYPFYGISFNLLKRNLPFVIGMCELPHTLLEDEIGILERIIASFGGKKLIFPLFKKTLEHCDMLITVNEATRELYANHIPKSKIEVIPYGVDLDLFKYPHYH